MSKIVARELRLLAAVKLYELGRLSSGRAAELASMSRVEFLLALNRYKVFPFQDELEELERQHVILSTVINFHFQKPAISQKSLNLRQFGRFQNKKLCPCEV